MVIEILPDVHLVMYLFCLKFTNNTTKRFTYNRFNIAFTFLWVIFTKLGKLWSFEVMLCFFDYDGQ